MAKTIEEINEKIKSGKAVVVTAGEMINIVTEKGTKKASEEVDVVTTGTFGPMCSSGALFCFGHSEPRMRITKAYLNDVEVYSGLAAVDGYLGATQMKEGDPFNSEHPGKFKYGGAHVITDLLKGKEVTLKAESYGTDCYPRKTLEKKITLKDIPHAQLLNPRNAYQNYNCAINRDSDRDIYTYMGILKKGLANARYCSAGELSPLLNDPLFKTIGIGTRIFIGGTTGYVYWPGTQHVPNPPRLENGTPRCGSGTLGVTGDLKAMDPRYLQAVSLLGYGVSMCVGIGIPIPVLNEEMARYTSVSDKDIVCQVVDYSTDYPYPPKKKGGLGEVTYAELKTGKVNINGKEIPTASFSSISRAREIADQLKTWIKAGDFLLSNPVDLIPGPDTKKEILSTNPEFRR